MLDQQRWLQCGEAGIANIFRLEMRCAATLALLRMAMPAESRAVFKRKLFAG